MTARSDASLDLAEPKNIFSSSDLSLLDPARIPRHVAIIADGNRRWAKQRSLPPVMGHWEGAEVLIDITRAAAEIGIKTLTVYSFSTENWVRPENEIEALMNIFELYLIQKRELMVKEGVRFDAIGDLSRLPQRVQNALLETKRATESSERINLVLALNYGGRDEIRRAMVKILKENEQEKIRPEEVTEEMIGRYLDTTPWGDPEMLIRTSGEMRVSNFLLWQISYAEIFVTDVLWPDFSHKELLGAVHAYQRRSRRLGGAC